MIYNLEKEVYEALKKSSLTLVCAESCTAGMIAARLGTISGISEVLWGSFVSYQNAAKKYMLGIHQEEIDQYGAVSREIVEAMAMGALSNSSAGIALAITGIAGPHSDQTGTPVGTLWVCVAKRDASPSSVMFRVMGNRQRIRKTGTRKALNFLLQSIGS